MDVSSGSLPSGARSSDSLLLLLNLEPENRFSIAESDGHNVETAGRWVGRNTTAMLKVEWSAKRVGAVKSDSCDESAAPSLLKRRSPWGASKTDRVRIHTTGIVRRRHILSG